MKTTDSAALRYCKSGPIIQSVFVCRTIGYRGGWNAPRWQWDVNAATADINRCRRPHRSRLPAMSKQLTVTYRIWLVSVFVLFFIVPALAQIGSPQTGGVSSVGPKQQTSPDLRGTWSGTFISRNSDISPFTITVKINHDSGGHLVGDASLSLGLPEEPPPSHKDKWLEYRTRRERCRWGQCHL